MQSAAVVAVVAAVAYGEEGFAAKVIQEKEMHSVVTGKV